MRPYLFLFLLLAIDSGNAQPPAFSHIGVENGLSQNSVLCITRDTRGYMWYGTRNGLNKHDSYRITVYKNSPETPGSLSNNYIQALLSDRKGNLWVGTHEGLNRYLPQTDNFERIIIKDSAAPLPRQNITSLFEDSKRRLWIGTAHTLYLATSQAPWQFRSFRRYPAFPTQGIICLTEDREGNIWAGTYGGAVKITAQGNDFAIQVLRHNPTSTNSLSEDQVTSITQDKTGRLWMGTLNSGLDMYQPATGSFTHYTHTTDNNSLVNNHVRRLLFDCKEQLWIGTQEGISILNTTSGRFTNCINNPWDTYSLSQNSIHSLFRGEAGAIWAGTFFGGVNMYNPYIAAFSVYNNRSQPIRLSNNVISALTEDNAQQLWIGTEGGGLNCVNRKTGAVIWYRHNAADNKSIGSNLVKTVYKDKQGHIWAGTHGGGLNLFNAGSGSFTRYLYKENDPGTQGAEITALLEDSNGLFWVGSEIAGLRLFRKNGTTLLPYPEGNSIIQAVGSKHILALRETGDHVIWAATSSGLYRIAGEKVQLLPSPGSATPWPVNCITPDAQGNIWAGTFYHGVTVYNAAGKPIATYTRQNGLPDDNIPGIVEDTATKSMWVSTGNGLARYSTVSSRFTTYTEADGLAGNVFNNYSYYQSSDGAIFFGGFNGLSWFYPKHIVTNSRIPHVVLNGLHLASASDSSGAHNLWLKSRQADAYITLRHNQNVFSIDFAILNFIKPEKNRYAWQLQGFDKNWNYTTQPTASFTNVPPGHYTFLVKGANNDGYWSSPCALHITIRPPFWRTWWAYCLYTLLMLTLVFFITRFFFLRALLARNQELTRLKLNFFTNISHEIRTHLSLITGPAEKLLATPVNEEQQQQLRTIKNNSESLLQLLNELMDFRKAETGHLALHVAPRNLVSFAASVFESFYDLSVARNIQTTFISELTETEIWFDREQLKKVLYNLLFNAFKFTPDGGSIQLILTDHTHAVTLTITDNGKGIAPENLGKLFDNYFQEDDAGKQNTGYGIGLALCKSIVETHHGTLTVTSHSTQTQKQTSFTVTLLKGKAHFTPVQLASGTGQPGTSTPATSLLPTPAASLLTAEASNAPATAQEQYTTEPVTILLTEDNTSIRNFIKDSLSKHYHLLESSNGAEGLAMAMEHIPDLIISDVMMPEMDGLTFCRQIKTDPRTSHIPVILLTAKTGVANQVSGLATGADSYLTKPFSIQVLELQIHNLLAHRSRLWQHFQQELQTTNTPGPAPATAVENAAIPVTPAENAEATAPQLHPLDQAFIQNIIQITEAHLEDASFGIALLSRKAGMSQPVLFKKIKAITGISANDFVKSLRLKKAASLLQENRYTIYEIAGMVGYENSKYFSREFKKQFGQTPSEYAKKE